MNAVKAGKIKRGLCVKCGAQKVEGHHPDYSKPLEAVWLCNKHHMELHRKSDLLSRINEQDMEKEILWQFQNDWVQLSGGYNWTTWRLLQWEIERDYQFDGWTMTFMLLGIGFYVRYNSGKDTEDSLEIERRAREVQEKL